MKSLTTQIFSLVMLAALASNACTEQLPGSFRLAQQVQTFSAQQEVNTKIDLLWVVDNSASMDISQEKLRKGLKGFATKYMQPTWDIRVAVITTDVYLAHPSFRPYLDRVITSTVGYRSPYINTRLSTFTNPDWNRNLINHNKGTFDDGIKYGELVPVWRRDYSRLLPGLHDGPIPALCFEALPYFIKGITQCKVRDNQDSNSGISHCLNPDTNNGESGVSQCVNTVQNDSIHTGQPIISTLFKAPGGLTPEQTKAMVDGQVQNLIQAFMINVTTGSAGQGSERGLGSLVQLLEDNEKTETRFFRPDSLRGIIFVSDEEDQTMVIPDSPPSGFSPQTYYKCDEGSLLSMNSTAAVSGTNGYCCSDPSKNCSYGSEGTSCPKKTIDGHTYAVSICPREDKLVPVSGVKDKLDQFFLTLDENKYDSANYFVVAIVPLTAKSIQDLQSERTVSDTAVGAIKTIAVDRGDRYIELTNLVGSGSLAMNIADSDYSPILDAIGQSIVSKKGTFQLSRKPTGTEDMIVKVAHEDGTSTVVSSDKLKISEKSITITDNEFILSLKATDRIVIDYQPKTVF